MDTSATPQYDKIGQYDKKDEKITTLTTFTTLRNLEGLKGLNLGVDTMDTSPKAQYDKVGAVDCHDFAGAKDTNLAQGDKMAVCKGDKKGA